MKLILVFLAFSIIGCKTYTKDEVIQINRALIKHQQYHCGDLICESSDDLSRPEVVMRLLSDSLTWNWDDIENEHIQGVIEEYKDRDWSE